MLAGVVRRIPLPTASAHPPAHGAAKPASPRAAAALIAVAMVANSRPSWADEGPSLGEPSASTDRTLFGKPRDPGDKPPPPRQAFIQYGVAFTVEDVAAAGPICGNPANPCILGSGGGIAIRVGLRPTEWFYLGGAYEFSKQDPDKLYRLGILQQARGELRFYLPNGHEMTPFVLLGLGVAAYGNEWSVDTWGAGATLGAGVELELTGGVEVGVTLVYRALALHSYADSSTQFHDGGISHIVGLELALEAQEGL